MLPERDIKWAIFFCTEALSGAFVEREIEEL